VSAFFAVCRHCCWVLCVLCGTGRLYTYTVLSTVYFL
jgi:hypothetical protein